jgi:predicted amidohydrolase
MTIRIAGAQIPVGKNVEVNKKEILNAIAWAKENNVDQLVTPECALSGYLHHWIDKIEEIEESLKEIEDFAKKM